MNLDELLKSIRDEGKKESTLSSTSSTVNTEDEKLVEEVIDPRVLEILGIDFTGDLTYGEYKTILKEKMAAQRMGSKVDSGAAEAVTEEFKRVKRKNDKKRFKVKKTKISSKDIKGKKNKTNPSGTKVKPAKGLLPRTEQKALPDGKDDEEDEKKKKIRKKKGSDDNLLKNVIVIKKTVKQIENILKKQGELFKKSGEKSRISAEKGRKKSREDMLESAKGGAGKVIDKIKKPFTSIFDAIKRFLLFTLLGSLLGTLLKIFENPKKFFLQPIQNIIDSIFGFFNKIINFIDDTFIEPFRFIIEKVEEGLNFFIDRINDVLSLIPGAPKIDKLELPEIPELPELEAPDIIGEDEEQPDITPVEGKDGADGADGKDGKDGKDAQISPKPSTPQVKPQDQPTPPTSPAPQGSDTEKSTPVQAFSGGGPVNQLMSMKKGGGAKSSRSSSKLGTDTVPAMLTPGEFVMSKEAVDKIGLANLMQMNKEGGGTNNPNVISGISFGGGAGTIDNEKVWNRKNLKSGELKKSNKTIDKLKKIEKEKGVRSVDVGSDLANKGGKVEKDTGVKIEGLGPDTQLTALQPGEVVVTKKAAKAIGIENLLKVNEALGGSNKAKKAKLGDITLSAMTDGGQVGDSPKRKHPLLEKLSDANIKKASAPIGRCVTGSLDTMLKSGVPEPAATGNDVGNNPRGAISQLMQSPFNWKSMGGSPITLKSPYGEVRAGQYSGTQYDGLVSGGKVPSGALVFQTRHNSWNGTSYNSRGYDMAIAQRGGKEHWNGQPMPQHIYSSVKKVIVLTPDGKKGDGSDAKIAPGQGSDEVAGDTPSTSGYNSPQEKKIEIKKVYNADGTLNFNKTFIHKDLMAGGTFGGSFLNKTKDASKSPQVDTSKMVPSEGSQFALDPTQTGASSPAVFKAAQEARKKARAEGLSPEEVEKRVVAASIAAKKGQNVPQMSKSSKSNIPQAPAKKTPQVLPLPGMGGGKQQNKAIGGTHTGGGTPPVAFPSTNPAEVGHRSAIKSLLGIVG